MSVDAVFNSQFVRKNTTVGQTRMQPFPCHIGVEVKKWQMLYGASVFL